MWWGNIVPGAAMRGTTMPARGAAAERSTGGQSREGSGRGGDRAALPGADDAEALAPDYRRIVELVESGPGGGEGGGEVDRVRARAGVDAGEDRGVRSKARRLLERGWPAVSPSGRFTPRQATVSVPAAAGKPGGRGDGTPRLVDCSKRTHGPALGYGEVGRCGERSTSRVISLGAKTRNGGPQKPVPRLV